MTVTMYFSNYIIRLLVVHETTFGIRIRNGTNDYYSKFCKVIKISSSIELYDNTGQKVNGLYIIIQYKYYKKRISIFMTKHSFFFYIRACSNCYF